MKGNLSEDTGGTYGEFFVKSVGLWCGIENTEVIFNVFRVFHPFPQYILIVLTFFLIYLWAILVFIRSALDFCLNLWVIR